MTVTYDPGCLKTQADLSAVYGMNGGVEIWYADGTEATLSRRAGNPLFQEHDGDSSLAVNSMRLVRGNRGQATAVESLSKG